MDAPNDVPSLQSESIDDAGVYFVENGDSLASVAAKFNLRPSRLCQMNKLRSSHIFEGQRLLVINKEPESYQYHVENNTKLEETEIPAETDVPNIARDIRYRRIFRRLIGAEMLERHRMAKVMQADERETNDPFAAGCLKIDGRYCCNLHQSVTGILLATFETLLFFPDKDYEGSPLFQQASVEMPHGLIRSIAAYRDPSVFAFTKRPRILQETNSIATIMDSHDSTTLESFEKDNLTVLEPTLGKDEVFLCCSIRRNVASSAGTGSPTRQTARAQWFIIPRQSIEDLHNFLIGCDVGFTSVFEDFIHQIDPNVVASSTAPKSSVSTPTTVTSAAFSGEENTDSNPFEALILGRFRGQDSNASPSTANSPSAPTNFLGRSFGRLIRQGKSSMRRQKVAPMTTDQHRRPLSIGSSEEHFADHATIYDRVDSTNFGGCQLDKSLPSPSTPSFASEKEVFDALRLTSLEWELVSQHEFQQRCIDLETDSGTRKKSLAWPPPPSLSHSRVLSGPTQIHELFDAVPTSSQLLDWFLTFSTEQHGFSLKTLYRRCDKFISGELTFDNANEQQHRPSLTMAQFENEVIPTHHRSLSARQQIQPCVLLIKDTADNVMGAYLSSHPRVSNGVFYGNGESFVFHWTPQGLPCSCDAELVESITGEDNTSFKRYRWSRKNSFFISGEQDVFLVGCSNACSSLWIDESLNRGRSQLCETFDNPPLTPSEDFLIHTLEIWSLG